MACVICALQFEMYTIINFLIFSSVVRLPYNNIFGGTGAFTREHFEKINGFSNSYWGWGGEDDDLYKR